MIRKTILLLVAVLAVTATFGDFKFDFDRAHIDRQSYRDAIVIPCSGGSDDYEFEIKGLANGWQADQNKIYVPAGSYKENKYYGVKVGAFDRVYRQFIRKTFIFSIKSFQIADYVEVEYEADISTDAKVEEIVRQRKYNYDKKPVTFVDFPNLTDIEEYVNRGDVNYLRKVIDDALYSGKDCKLIADYLTRFLSVVQVRLTVLKNNAEAARQDLSVIQEELVFLRKQLQERKGQNINIYALQRKIELLRNEIDQLVYENKDAERRLSDKRDSIRVSEQEIYGIKVEKIPGARDQINAAGVQIDRIDLEIKDLQKRIAFLQIDRSRYIGKREEAKKILDNAEERINILTQIIASGQAEVRKYEARIEENSFTIRNLEARIADIQAEINAGADNSQTIRDLEIRIAEISAAIDERKATLANVERIIQSIEVHVGTFEKTINKHYYSCYQFDDSAADNTQDDQVVVVAPNDAFTNYLKDVFGYTPSQNIRARFSGEQITFKHLSIFSPAWIKVYGIPFSAGYGNNMDIMETEFSCETYGEDQLDVFDGKILRVDRNVVDVRAKTGEEYTVHLGGCTRIETATEHEIPQVGDNIFFKGKFRRTGAKKEYNGYHLTCY